ncbi:MAG: four-carbon acid sugar kinase family protein [Rhizobiaceae bacterium]|nr:four-carbon acid sugar kinase family protein [Rhizobiaceae bacterium]
MAPRVVFLGDDFTGASDTLATFTRAGWSTRLFLDLPERQQVDGLDAVGIASNLRGLSREDIAVEIARLAPGIKALGADLIHYKVCSTFDSSPQIGSIGEALRGLETVLKPGVTAIIGGQPGLGRYCAFGNLFARASDGKTHRIDRHPVMRAHPVTPMGEADLIRHLDAQGIDALFLLSQPELEAMPPAQLAKRLHGRVLLDVMAQSDLLRIGKALQKVAGIRLLIGASSVAEALTGASTKRPADALEPLATSSGILVFAGSRSSVTSTQVDAAEGFERLCITPQELASPEQIINCTIDRLNRAIPVLLHLDPQAEYALDSAALAAQSAHLVARVLEQVPVGWLGLAGGDTSSTICQQLGFRDLRYLDAMDAGVSLCLAAHADPTLDDMRIMLKGGQMGQSDLFSRFASRAGLGR